MLAGIRAAQFKLLDTQARLAITASCWLSTNQHLLDHLFLPMVRSKRHIGDSNAANHPSSQKMAHQEIIVIDGDDDDKYAPRPRRKASAPKPTTVDTSNGSDIEIIEDPVELESLSKLKGKGKRKAPSSPQSSPKKKRPRRVSRDEDEAEAQMNADAEMARRMAMEWEDEVAPEPNGQPQAGPSTQSQPSTSHASTSYSTKEIIEIVSTAPSRASTQDRDMKEVVEVLSSGVSRATTIDSVRDLSRPTAPSTSKIPAQILDIPYVHLPNPELKLQEFKDLLTSNRECSECGQFVDASNGQVCAFVNPQFLYLSASPFI